MRAGHTHFVLDVRFGRYPAGTPRYPVGAPDDATDSALLAWLAPRASTADFGRTPCSSGP